MPEPGRSAGSDGGRRPKRSLSPSQKYEIWIGLLRAEVSTVERRGRVPRRVDAATKHELLDLIDRALADRLGASPRLQLSRAGRGAGVAVARPAR
jgi:hypothetical protein